MGNNSSEGGTLGHLDGFQSLRYRANLIEFDENRIGGLFLNASLETCCIGYEQVISYKLYTITQPLAQKFPTVPVVFSQSVFNTDDRILVYPLLIEINHLA